MKTTKQVTLYTDDSQISEIESMKFGKGLARIFERE